MDVRHQEQAYNQRQHLEKKSPFSLHRRESSTFLGTSHQRASFGMTLHRQMTNHHLHWRQSARPLQFAQENGHFQNINIWGFPKMGLSRFIIRFRWGFSIINHPAMGIPIRLGYSSQFHKPQTCGWLMIGFTILYN